MNYDIKIDKFSTKYYYVNNVLHREDGPAVEYVNGSKCWYKNGNIHRDGGPAMEFVDGRKYWYKNGKRHREYGPAIEYKEVKFWFLNDILYGKNDAFTVESWQKFIKTIIFS